MIPRPLLRPLWATALIAAVAAPWTISSVARGESKMRGVPAGNRLDLAITLDFNPEAFHITRAQEIGQLMRVDGATLYIADARREAAERFARSYWVARVDPWQRSP